MKNKFLSTFTVFFAHKFLSISRMCSDDPSMYISRMLIPCLKTPVHMPNVDSMLANKLV